MRLKYAMLFCLGGCTAYTYDYGTGRMQGRAYAPMGSPLTREEVPPAPNVRAAPQIYGLVAPAPQPQAAPLASLPRGATPAPPPAPAAAPVELAGGKSAAEGLKLIAPPQPERAFPSDALSDPALRELLILGAERSPAVAFGLSLGVGFGSGHYYAEDIGTARVIMGGQILGLGMMVLGLAAENAEDEELEEGERGPEGLTELGALVFVGFKVYEVLTVGSAAKKYNERLRSKFGVAVAPTRGGAMVGAGVRF